MSSLEGFAAVPISSPPSPSTSGRGPKHAALLFGWCGKELVGVKDRSAGCSRLLYIVTENAIFSTGLKKELLIQEVDQPKTFNGFLGTTFSYYPLVDLHYRSGGFRNQRFAAIMPGESTIVFSYDLTSETLFVKAKVTIVSQDQATAGLAVAAL